MSKGKMSKLSPRHLVQAKNAEIQQMRAKLRMLKAEKATARANAMAERLAKGETLQAIGDDHGISRERVRQVASEVGGGSVRTSRPHPTPSEEQAIIKAYRAGGSVAEVSTEFRRCKGTVKRILHEHGVAVSRPQSRWTLAAAYLVAGGLPMGEIARRCNLFPETLYPLKKKIIAAGIKVPIAPDARKVKKTKSKRRSGATK